MSRCVFRFCLQIGPVKPKTTDQTVGLICAYAKLKCKLHRVRVETGFRSTQIAYLLNRYSPSTRAPQEETRLPPPRRIPKEVWPRKSSFPDAEFWPGRPEEPTLEEFGNSGGAN